MNSPSINISATRKLLIILIVTLNLRGAITCVGPLLETIQTQLGLSGSAAGLLASLPLFAFGFVSPYAAVLARRIGIEQAIFVSLLLLLSGLALRYVQNIFCLYFGTALIGSGIAISNVLLPGLLRRDFSQQLAMVTAVFTMVLVICGGLGSGISIPLAQLGGGWRFSLVAWAIPALLALAVWVSQLQQYSKPSAQEEKSAKLWYQPLAWQVSLFMACQATAFYVMIAWFPSMMSELQGISAARSGWILFIFQIAILSAVMLVPVFMRKLRDQRLLGIGVSSLIVIAYFGLLVDSEHALAWMILMGLGSGGSLVLAMTLFGLRTSTALQTVALSGMAQAIGYTVAAITPIIIGFIHDQSGRWTIPLTLMIGLAIAQLLMAYLAGRPLTIPAQNGK